MLENDVFSFFSTVFGGFLNHAFKEIVCFVWEES